MSYPPPPPEPWPYPVPPKEPRATTALILGICGTVIIAFGLAVVTGLGAWWMADPTSFETFWAS